MPTSERKTGIRTTGADSYVATFRASEDVDGGERLVQIISMTSGKIDESIGASTRSVSSDDSLDLTTLSGSVQIGDDGYFACYVRHSQKNGQCLITPLLCDNNGVVIGALNSKTSKVMLPVASGSNYIANCLSWPVMETGAWRIFPHVADLSDANSVQMWCFTF